MLVLMRLRHAGMHAPPQRQFKVRLHSVCIGTATMATPSIAVHVECTRDVTYHLLVTPDEAMMTVNQVARPRQVQVSGVV